MGWEKIEHYNYEDLLKMAHRRERQGKQEWGNGQWDIALSKFRDALAIRVSILGPQVVIVSSDDGKEGTTDITTTTAKETEMNLKSLINAFAWLARCYYCMDRPTDAIGARHCSIRLRSLLVTQSGDKKDVSTTTPLADPNDSFLLAYGEEKRIFYQNNYTMSIPYELEGDAKRWKEDYYGSLESYKQALMVEKSFQFGFDTPVSALLVRKIAIVKARRRFKEERSNNDSMKLPLMDWKKADLFSEHFLLHQYPSNGLHLDLTREIQKGDRQYKKLNFGAAVASYTRASKLGNIRGGGTTSSPSPTGGVQAASIVQAQAQGTPTTSNRESEKENGSRTGSLLGPMRNNSGSDYPSVVVVDQDQLLLQQQQQKEQQQDVATKPPSTVVTDQMQHVLTNGAGQPKLHISGTYDTTTTTTTKKPKDIGAISALMVDTPPTSPDRQQLQLQQQSSSTTTNEKETDLVWNHHMIQQSQIISKAEQYELDGRNQWSLGHWEKALHKFRDSLSLRLSIVTTTSNNTYTDPAIVSIFAWIARCYFCMDRPMLAIGAGHYPLRLGGKGGSNNENGKEPLSAESIRCFRLAYGEDRLQFYKLNFDISFNNEQLGDDYRSNGNYSMAIKYYQNAIQLERNFQLEFATPVLALLVRKLALVHGLYKYHDSEVSPPNGHDWSHADLFHNDWLMNHSMNNTSSTTTSNTIPNGGLLFTTESIALIQKGDKQFKKLNFGAAVRSYERVEMAPPPLMKMNMMSTTTTTTTTSDDNNGGSRLGIAPPPQILRNSTNTKDTTTTTNGTATIHDDKENTTTSVKKIVEGLEQQEAAIAATTTTTSQNNNPFKMLEDVVDRATTASAASAAATTNAASIFVPKMPTTAPAAAAPAAEVVSVEHIKSLEAALLRVEQTLSNALKAHQTANSDLLMAVGQTMEVINATKQITALTSSSLSSGGVGVGGLE